MGDMGKPNCHEVDKVYLDYIKSVLNVRKSTEIAMFFLMERLSMRVKILLRFFKFWFNSYKAIIILRDQFLKQMLL